MSSPRHRSTETRNSSTKVRIWLLISLAFSACAFGKGPLEVVSYYVSKEHAQVRFARLISTNPQDVYSNEPLERMPEMKVLEKAPFKSRFFNDGDEIYDASPLFDPLIPKKTSGFSAVLNKSAGRLVVRGKAGHQFLVKAVLVRRDVPVQVRGKFDVYLLPPGEDVMSVSNLEFLPKGWRKLSSSTEIGYSGRELIAKDPQGELEVKFEHFADSSKSVIINRGRYEFKTKIEGEEVEISGGLPFYALSGVARIVDMGSYGKSRNRLCLVQKLEIVHVDGTSIDEFVSREVSSLPYHFEETRRHFMRHELSYYESEGEEPYGIWPVPPTFADFILTADESKKIGKAIPGFGGHTDFREPLEAVGIDFKEGDSAILFPGRGVLIVQANPSQLELVHAVCLAAGVGPPRDIKVFVGLVESGSDSDIEKLTAPSVSLLAHGVASLAPGQLDIYSCKSAGQTSRFEVAAQIGARDDIVDLRLEGEIKIGGDKPTEFKTGLTLRSGETVVFSKNKVGGKWRALVVRAEIREALDELPE